MIVKCLPVGELETNCYIVADEATRVGVLIDPGAEPERILEAVKRANVKISAILVTHGHFDHVGAVASLQEVLNVPLWCSEIDSPWAINCAKQGLEFGVRVAKAPAKVDFYLVEGETVCYDPLSFRVMHTPGHTPGGVTLVIGKYAFTGDTLFAGSVGRSDFEGGSHKELMDSIRRKIYSLEDDTIVCPGHGPQSTIGEEKRTNPFVRNIPGFNN